MITNDGDKLGPTLGTLRDRVAARSTSAPRRAMSGSGSMTKEASHQTFIPPAPGGMRFRRVMAWLGLSLPIWVTAVGALSPVTVRCTSVSLAEVSDPHFAQVAVVCWVAFRDLSRTMNEPSDGSESKSVRQSLGLTTKEGATTRETRWALMLQAEAAR